MLALLHFTPLWLSVEITAVWRTSVPRLIECLIPDKKGFRLYNTVSPFFFLRSAVAFLTKTCLERLLVVGGAWMLLLGFVLQRMLENAYKLTSQRKD